MSAPWTAPLATDPRAVGLKNGGLREITHDIINVVSRAERGAFQSGVQQELRWRSDSSRMWLPRESRLVSTIEFKFGETALTGSGANTNRYM
eukprot:COSAG01_NODE_1727_length_9370_cov_10.117736_1_plen_91_part_10